MRQITKGREPRSLTEHRAAAYATYDNYADKDGLRDALLAEQGSLCCYCMSRIDAKRMKIEHWAAQDTHPERQLDYHNLLGACLGRQGSPREQQHCDTHKGNEALTLHPADPQRACEQVVFYRDDGRVDSHSAVVRRDLDEVLNLNVRSLRENRKAAVKGMQDVLQSKRAGGWPRAILERELRRWREPDDEGKYREYCRVVVFWLEKRLARERG